MARDEQPTKDPPPGHVRMFMDTSASSRHRHVEVRGVEIVDGKRLEMRVIMSETTEAKLEGEALDA